MNIPTLAKGKTYWLIHRRYVSPAVYRGYIESGEFMFYSFRTPIQTETYLGSSRILIVTEENFPLVFRR